MSKPSDQNPESTDATRPGKSPSQFRPDNPMPGQKTPHQVTPDDVIKAKDTARTDAVNGGDQQKS